MSLAVQQWVLCVFGVVVVGKRPILVFAEQDENKAAVFADVRPRMTQSREARTICTGLS